ncbi:substrate-binding periplasmic protein [Pseudomonas sp. Marseille-QA0892]
MRQLLFTLLMVMAGESFAQDRLRLTSGEWPPYLGSALPHRGVGSRIVEEAFAIQGIAVSWEFYPWARSLRLAELGQRDGSALWLRTPERLAAYYVSDPVLESEYYLFYRTNAPLPERAEMEHMQGLRVAAVIGHYYGEAFRDAEADGTLDVIRVSREAQALDLLLAARVDVVPIDRIAADTILDRLSEEQRTAIMESPHVWRRESLHLMLSRKNPENAARIQAFNRGLAILKARGTIEAYVKQMASELDIP